MHTCIHIYICACVYIYIYIYTHIQPLAAAVEALHQVLEAHGLHYAICIVLVQCNLMYYTYTCTILIHALYYTTIQYA